MGLLDKFGGWVTDKSNRFIQGGDHAAPRSYYASSEAEEAYGRMGDEMAPNMTETQDAGNETQRRGVDPFDRAGKDYGGRSVYKSQRELQAEQAAMEAERQRGWQQGNQPSAFAQSRQVQGQPPQGYGQPNYGGMGQPYPTQPSQGTMTQPQPTQPQRPVPQQPAAPQPNNVVNFPGVRQSPEGNAFNHIEYLVLLRSRNECTKVIEYIKTNASVFLNMEFIANDGERQRCVDMLSGAAYTLGCKLNRISNRGMYLISSPSVYVVMDESMQGFSLAPESQGYVRQNYETSGYGGRQGAGYSQRGGYPRGAYEERQPSRFAPQAQAPYPQQNTQRRTPVSFGSMMAGNATGTYAASPGYQAGDGQTGRFSMTDYPQ